jgi:hypothetical protein
MEVSGMNDTKKETAANSNIGSKKSTQHHQIKRDNQYFVDRAQV